MNVRDLKFMAQSGSHEDVLEIHENVMKRWTIAEMSKKWSTHQKRE